MEGYVINEGFKIHFASTHDSSRSGTVLGLHGGPGATLDYLKVLENLGNFGYRVVLYDQLGCGKSDKPSDNSRYTLEYYVSECEKMRYELGLEKVNLFGHSWGAMLALAYALKYEENLQSLILSSGLSSVPFASDETNKLVSQFPPHAREIIRKYTDTKDFDNKEYLAIYDKYFRKAHSFRLKEVPQELDFTLKHINRKIFRYMEGPDDLHMTGTLKNWDVTDQLQRLKVPCLITVGKFDSLPPILSETMHEKIRNSRMVQFENSGHFAMWEETTKYITTLREFLDEINS